NALPTVAAGGGLLVADSDLTPDWLRDTVLPLLTDPGRLTAMGLAARRSAVADASGALLRMTLAACGRIAP
ncbi:MAG: UDP-N-acetylglucosamine--N-acetylmuramyl-(pentapeptide) pyrophosphoryl-undecaprenol N-acetylglucosamine transferase, partial [Mycobacteriales bacterium]